MSCLSYGCFTNQLINDKETLYNILSSTVLEGIEILNNLDLVHLYIDRSKTIKEIEIFDKYIKANLEKMMPINANLNIEHIKSEKNAGLQSVDMFCYGIARKYDQNDDRWYNIFKDKIKKEIIYRP